MIPEVVIGVRDEDTEHDAPPELLHIPLRCRPVLAEDIDNLEVAAGLVVARLRHAHRRQKR